MADIEEEFDFADDIDIFATNTGDREPASTTQMVTQNLTDIGRKSGAAAKKEIESAMPNTANLMRELGQVGTVVSELKDEFQENLQPTINEVKRAVHRSMPMAKRFLPQKLYDAIEKRVSTHTTQDSYRAPTDAERNQEHVASTLAAIFEAQEEGKSYERVEQRATAIADRITEKIHHRDNISALDQIAGQINFQNRFISSAKTAWMKKTLETQMHHLFVSRQALSTATVTAKLLEANLADIKHNTALPDIVKVRRSELISAELGMKSRQFAMSKLSDFTSNYFGKISGNIKSWGKEKLIGGLRQVKEQADGMNSAMDMADGIGIDLSADNGNSGTTAGTLAGLITKFGGRRALDQLLPLIEGVEGESANFSNSAALYANTLREKLDSSGNPYLGMLSNLIPEYANNRTVGNNLLDNAEKTAEFDVMTRTSIVEIIPGYLSMMAKYLRDIATGEDTEAVVYDATRRAFNTESVTRKNITNRAFGDDASRSAHVIRAVGTTKAAFIDKNGAENTESFEAQQKKLARFFVNVALSGVNLDVVAIRDFALSDITDPAQTGSKFITRAFADIEDAQALARLLTMSIFKDGVRDHAVIRDINTAIIGAAREEGFKDILPRMMETFGYYTTMNDMVDEDRRFIDSKLKDEMLDISDDRLSKGTSDQASLYKNVIKRRRDDHEELADSRGAILLQDLFGNQLDAVRKLNLPILSEIASLLSDPEEQREYTLDPKGYIEQLRNVVSTKMDDTQRAAIRGVNNAKEFVGTSRTAARSKVDDVQVTTAKAISATQERLAEVHRELSNSMEHVVKHIAPESGPMQVQMVSDVPADRIDGKSFHENFMDYVRYKHNYDAMLLDAILSDGAGEAKQGLAKRLANTGGKIGGSILRTYGNIYGSVANSVGKAAESAFGFGTSALPFLGAGAGKIFDTGKDAVGGLFGFYKSILTSGIDATGNILGRGSKSKFVDLYLKGSITPGKPLLSVRVQKKYAVKADGARLESSADVDEPILDSRSGETIVTEEDLEIGLVDIYGKPASRYTLKPAKEKGAGGGIFGMLGSMAKGAGSLLGGGLGAYGNMYSTMFKSLSSGVSGLFGWATDKTKKYAPITERLDQIIEILKAVDTDKEDDGVAFDSDGDGDRDGSYLDQLRAKKDKLKKRMMVGPDGVARSLGVSSAAGAQGTPGTDKGFLGKLLDNPKLLGLLSSAGGMMGGKAGLAAAGKLAGPAAALAYLGYTNTKMAFDDEASDDHTQAVADAMDPEKQRKILEEKGLVKGTAINAWNKMKTVGRIDKNIGAVANQSMQLADELKGPKELQDLHDFLLNTGAVTDGFGWGDWKINDWDRIKRLPRRELMRLASSDKFSDDDLATIGRLAKAKHREEQRNKRIQAVPKSAPVNVVPDTDTPTTIPNVASTNVEDGAAVQNFRQKQLGEASDQKMLLDQMREQNRIAQENTAVMVATLEKVAANTGNMADHTANLQDIKKGIDKTAEGVGKPTTVVVPQQSGNEGPKVTRPTLPVHKEH